MVNLGVVGVGISSKQRFPKPSQSQSGASTSPVASPSVRVLVPKPYKGLQEADEHDSWLRQSSFVFLKLPQVLQIVVMQYCSMDMILLLTRASKATRTMLWRDKIEALEERQAQNEAFCGEVLREVGGVTPFEAAWSALNQELQQALDLLTKKDISCLRAYRSPPIG